MMPQKARILVVDDDPTIRRTMSIILEQTGYFVDTAENGEQAITMSEQSFYNLALIDVRLPDMEGTKLLTLLRDTTPKMIKIIMTGFPVLDNAVEAINRGVDGYITKPMSTEKLLNTVKEQLLKQDRERVLTEEKLKDYVASKFKQARTIRREIASVHVE